MIIIYWFFYDKDKNKIIKIMKIIKEKIMWMYHDILYSKYITYKKHKIII